jgi:hypothetical protein
MNKTNHERSNIENFIIPVVTTIGLIVLSIITYSYPVHSQIGNLSTNPSLNFTSLLSSLIRTVSGTYDNPNLGFTIDLPQGWNGTEMNFLANVVVAGPEGLGSFSENLMNQSSLEKSHAMMTIIGFDKNTFDRMKSFTQSMLSGFNSSSMTNMMGQLRKDAKCVKTVDSPIIINGVTGQQISYECEGKLFAGKIKGYTFATKNDSLITVSFFANSTSGYDKYLPQFEDSIKTLKISNPINIQSSPIFKEYQKFAGLYNQTK